MERLRERGKLACERDKDGMGGDSGAATRGSDVESGNGETTTFDGVSRVGSDRKGGFDEIRGAEDGFGRGHGAWPTAPACGGERREGVRNRGKRERDGVRAIL